MNCSLPANEMKTKESQMRKPTRIVLFAVFATLFTIMPFVNWYLGFWAWPSLRYAPKAGETLLRIICMLLWIDFGIVACVLVWRWYFVFPFVFVSALESLLSPAGFSYIKEYPFDQILQKGYLLYHVISSFSGLIVCSVMIVMLVVRLCILDRLCQGTASLNNPSNADPDSVNQKEVCR